MATRIKELVHARRPPFGACCAIVLLAAAAAPATAGAASSWALQQLPPAPGDQWGPPLSGVSCPTESLCVAVGGLDTLAFSRNPAGGAGAWRVVNPSAGIGPGKTCVEGEPGCRRAWGRLKAVSCASESLCVAVSYEGFAYASTDPAGGAGAWPATLIREGKGAGATHLTSVSCPSPSLCVAVSGGYRAPGRVLTTTEPTAGRWQAAELGNPLDLRGVSCGTPTFCVAVAREGRMFVSTEPTGGAAAWREAGTPGGPGDLEGIDCLATVLCAAGNLTGNVLTSTSPATTGAPWRETNAGGSVQITGVDCPTATGCVAVDNNGDVVTSTDPTGGPGSWDFENLIEFLPVENTEGQPPRNALFGVSCPTRSLCALVGSDGHVFTSTDPFAGPEAPPARRARKRPRTIILFAENFWKVAVTRRHRIRARFRFYSPSQSRGFECKRDRRRYRPCRSPLRYWTGHGRHVLHVRAVGPTGLRGPAAVKRFRVKAPLPPIAGI